MHVLISWSGQQSRDIAASLYEWLPTVIPGIQPWISTDDIAIGTQWFATLMSKLESTSLCVICLTPQNVRSPWLYFEAGAIAGKRTDARVCTYLIGLSGNQLMAGPLSQFQWAEADKNGTWKLVLEINRCLPIPHNDTLLQVGFDAKWTTLKRRLEKAISEYSPKESESQVETEELKPVYRLSSEARQLLIEASKDPHGIVLMIRSLGGLHIQTNGKQIGNIGHPRTEAIWQAAVRELLNNNLLQSRGNQGHVFSLTAEGYRIVDLINSEQHQATTS